VTVVLNICILCFMVRANTLIIVNNILTIAIMVPLHQHCNIKETWPIYRNIEDRNIEDTGAETVISHSYHFIEREVTRVKGFFFDHDRLLKDHLQGRI
jgi:hypothetical protein